MAARTTGGGWISTLLGGAVLAVGGFSVGLLGGGLWESPDLVFHYLMGNTEEVAAQELPVPPKERLSASPAATAPETAAVSKPKRAA